MRIISHKKCRTFSDETKFPVAYRLIDGAGREWNCTLGGNGVSWPGDNATPATSDIGDLKANQSEAGFVVKEHWEQHYVEWQEAIKENT